MVDCILKMQHYMDEFSPAQRRVAEYLLQNAAEVVGMSIEHVAVSCNTSKASVVRLCKMLGYSGYKGFCIALASGLAAAGAQNRISYAEVHQSDDLRTTLQSVTRYAQDAISDTMRVLDEGVFARVVEAIVGAKRVDFYGMGSSGLVALDAQQKFLRLGKYSQTSLDSHAQLVMACSLEKGDVAVLLSYSGENLDMLDTLKAVRRTDALAVSITRYGASRLSRAADQSLFVVSPEQAVRIGAMSSRIAMLHMVDLLFSAVTAQTFDASKPYLDKTLLAARDKRGAQRDRSKK